MDNNSNSVINFFLLNDDKTRKGEIKHDTHDKEHHLGILLKTNNGIGGGFAAHFFSPNVPTKIAIIKTDLEWVAAGRLIRFNENEYYQKLETCVGLTFSRTLPSYLDESPYMTKGGLNYDKGTIFFKILNFEVKKIENTERKDFRSFNHPIFGRVLFDSNNEVICKWYPTIPVESSIPMQTRTYANVDFIVNFNVEEENKAHQQKRVEDWMSSSSKTVAQKIGNDENGGMNSYEQSGLSVAPSQKNEVIIDPSDEDTIHGVFWAKMDDTHVHVFCKDMPKQMVNLKIPATQNIPLGSLVKFSKAEYHRCKEKLRIGSKKPKIYVSTVEVTHLPNHQQFRIKLNENGRHFVSLENYNITTINERDGHYEFEHDIFGTIKDDMKIIRNGVFRKINLNANHRFAYTDMNFDVYNAFKIPVMTEAEKRLLQLPIEEQSRRFVEFIRCREAEVVEEETRKWKGLGTLVILRMTMLDNVAGEVPYFEATEKSHLIFQILKHKSVTVFLKNPDMEQNLSDDLITGIPIQHKRGFCFIPFDRNIIFKVGQKFEFVPIIVRKNADYFEKQKRLGKKLFHVDCMPKPVEVDSKALKEMYSSDIKTADLKIIEDGSVLNDMQRRAVGMALNESRKVVIIHGPPATGKTRIFAEIICEFVSRRKNLFVLAPTNSIMESVFKAALDLLSERGIHQSEQNTPVLLTNQTLFEEVENCNLTKNMAELKTKLERGEIDQYHHDLKLNEIQNIVMGSLFQHASVCFATTTDSFLHIATKYGFKATTTLVDGAGMVVEDDLKTSLPLMTRLIMAVDPMEQPRSVGSAIHQTSVMERLMNGNSNSRNYIMLNVQYRMHPEIMKISNELFYNCQMRAHRSLRHINLLDLHATPFNAMSSANEPKQLIRPVVFCDTARFEQPAHTKELACFDKLVYLNNRTPSYSNPGEAILVTRYVTILLNNRVDMSKVSIITPYKAQVKAIQDLLETTERTQNRKIKVGTIDMFQGKENEIVILSLVRNNPKNAVGIVLDESRFNIMLTRAKRQLFIIGNSSSFLFNERGKLPQFAQILKSTSSVFVRSILKKKYNDWPDRQSDDFGYQCKHYLAFNTQDEAMKLFIEKLVENKEAAMRENDDIDTIE